jgi:hypothetical protein
MSLFDESLVNDLAAKWKIVEKKDHSKTTLYFKKYEDQFINEVMDHVMPRKDAMMKRLAWLCKSHSEEIELPLFSYKMTNFGDNKTKTKNGMKKFNDTETYRDAAIRLNYHKLCRALPDAPMITETNDDGKEVSYPERPAPFHFVYEFTDVRYKISEKFGDKFTIVKKWRPSNNFDEGFGNDHNMKTYQVTLFLKFHPNGIEDDDWMSKRPSNN